MLRRLARIWKIPVWMFWDLCSNPVWYSANVVRAQRIAPLWSTPVDQWWMDHDRSLLWWLGSKRFKWKKTKVRWHLSCPDPWHPDILFATLRRSVRVPLMWLFCWMEATVSLSWADGAKKGATWENPLWNVSLESPKLKWKTHQTKTRLTSTSNMSNIYVVITKYLPGSFVRSLFQSDSKFNIKPCRCAGRWGLIWFDNPRCEIRTLRP